MAGRKLAIGILTCIVVPVIADAVFFTSGLILDIFWLKMTGTALLLVPVAFLLWLRRVMKSEPSKKDGTG